MFTIITSDENNLLPAALALAIRKKQDMLIPLWIASFTVNKYRFHRIKLWKHVRNAMRFVHV